MNTSPPEIMTIEDVAEFLRLPLSSAYKLAHAGKIPGQKVGRHWRFHRQTLVNWVAGQQALMAPPPAQPSAIPLKPDMQESA